MKAILLLVVVVLACQLVDAKVGMMAGRHRSLASARTKALPKAACETGDKLFEAICGNDKVKEGIKRWGVWRTKHTTDATAEFSTLARVWPSAQKKWLAFMKANTNADEFESVEIDTSRVACSTAPDAEPYVIGAAIGGDYDCWAGSSSQGSHEKDAGVFTFASCDLGQVTTPGYSDKVAEFVMLHEAYGHRWDVVYANGLDTAGRVTGKVAAGKIASKVFGSVYDTIGKQWSGNKKTEHFCDYLALDVLTAASEFTTDEAVQVAGLFCAGGGGGTHPSAKDRVLTIARHPKLYDKLCDNVGGARGIKDKDWFATAPAANVIAQLQSLGDNPLAKLKKPTITKELVQKSHKGDVHVTDPK